MLVLSFSEGLREENVKKLSILCIFLTSQGGLIIYGVFSTKSSLNYNARLLVVQITILWSKHVLTSGPERHKANLWSSFLYQHTCMQAYQHNHSYNILIRIYVHFNEAYIKPNPL